MIEVELPDGTVLEFPDTMSEEEIKAAISQMEAPQAEEAPQDETEVERTIGQRLLRQLGLTGRAVIEGGAGLAGIVANPLNYTVNKIISPFTDYQLPQNLHEAASQTATAIGLPQPETTAERIAQAGAQSVVGAGGSLGLSRLAAEKLATSGSRLAAEAMSAQPTAQITGGAGAGIGQQATAELGGGTGAQIIASLLGGALGARGGMRATGPAQVAPELEQASKSGIDIMTSDIITPETFASKWLQRVGEMIPITGTAGQRQAQKAQRIDAIKDVARTFQADDVTISAIDSVADDLLRTRGAEVERFAKLKTGVINGLEKSGAVPVPKTLEAIDTQIADLEAMGTRSVRPVIELLKDWRQALQGKDLVVVEKIRKDLGEAFKSPELAAVKTTGEKALRSIYGPLNEDMGAFIAANGKPQDVTKWKVANKELASMMGELKNTTLKSVLEKGEMTPEDVKKLLFSAKPSDVKLLYKNLSPEGRSSARAAVLQEALVKAGETTSPEKFVNQLQRRSAQIGVVFGGDDLKAINGLIKALNMTRRATKASVMPETGIAAVPVYGSAVLADFLGSGGAAVASIGSIGGLARLYESKPVRDILVKLADSGISQAEEAALVKRLIATVQTVKEGEE